MGQNYSDLDVQRTKVTNTNENNLQHNEKVNPNQFDGGNSISADDPRSPSQRIDRTPLRDSSRPQRNVGEYKRLVNDTDPRSPCGEINRTPIKGSKPAGNGNNTSHSPQIV